MRWFITGFNDSFARSYYKNLDFLENDDEKERIIQNSVMKLVNIKKVKRTIPNMLIYGGYASKTCKIYPQVTYNTSELSIQVNECDAG
ncbi:20989_t:CDS:2 [Rhizophagus irregularis]|nr:20989_t:CDS:2 [Rhizophagus irregularis]